MKQRRETIQRKLVLASVRSRRDHPTAGQIYEDVHKLDKRISRGTVYRNLNLLAESGEINHIKAPGADRFDLTVAPHYHLICLECGRVLDTPFEYQKQNDEALSKQTGFTLVSHYTVYEGVCPECQNGKNKDNI
jgi:Fe2+ or Zn2+ uptake regulation protein